MVYEMFAKALQRLFSKFFIVKFANTGKMIQIQTDRIFFHTEKNTQTTEVISGVPRGSMYRPLSLPHTAIIDGV